MGQQKKKKEKKKTDKHPHTKTVNGVALRRIQEVRICMANDAVTTSKIPINLNVM